MRVTTQIQQFLEKVTKEEILIPLDDYMELVIEQDLPVGIKMPMVIKIEECEIRATEDSERYTDLDSEGDEYTSRTDGDDGEKLMENITFVSDSPI